MQEASEIIDLSVKAQAHCCLMNDFSSAVTNHRHAEHFLGAGIGNHFNDARRIVDRARARHQRHPNSITPTIVPSRDRFLLGHSYSRDLGVGENRARDDAVIDAARVACKCVVRGDAAILATDRRGHLAAHFAADHIAAGKNVRHVCAQEFIDADL